MYNVSKIKLFLLSTLLLTISSCSQFQRNNKRIEKTQVYIIKLSENIKNRNTFIFKMVNESMKQNFLIGFQPAVPKNRQHINVMNLENKEYRFFNNLLYSNIGFNQIILSQQENELLYNQENEDLALLKINYINIILSNPDYIKIIEEETFSLGESKDFKILTTFLLGMNGYNKFKKQERDFLLYQIQRSPLWSNDELFTHHNKKVIEKLIEGSNPIYNKFKNNLTYAILNDPLNEEKFNDFFDEVLVPWLIDNVYTNSQKLILRGSTEGKEVVILLKPYGYEHILKKFQKPEWKNKIILKTPK